MALVGVGDLARLLAGGDTDGEPKQGAAGVVRGRCATC